MTRILLICILGFFLTGYVAAPQNAQMEWDIQTAKKLKQAADAGDINAQKVTTALQSLVSSDYKKALALLTEAANANNTVAAATLGFMYKEPRGVPQDYAKAAYWFEKAAKLGDADARYEMGNLYFDGHGVKKNSNMALYWYSTAAAQGHPDAKAAVARIHNKN